MRAEEPARSSSRPRRRRRARRAEVKRQFFVEPLICWLFVGLYRQINVNVDVGVNTCMVAR